MHVIKLSIHVQIKQTENKQVLSQINTHVNLDIHKYTEHKCFINHSMHPTSRSKIISSHQIDTK